MSLVLAVGLAALAGAAAATFAFVLIFFSLRKNMDAERARDREELRGWLELAGQKWETERVKHQSELDEKRKAVETAVGRLSEQIGQCESLVREFEVERREKYGSLEKTLKDASESTGRLAAATEGLRSLLDNSRARGQWGERMAEDILRASGLKENVQYLKNRVQETSSTRPDFTFLLPDGHRLHMDVKFPLDNYVRMMNASSGEEKSRFKADFLRDAKARVKEIRNRDYINPAERTLDYVLLFIPNEQVYGFIHDASPGLLDEALAQKVVLCSPFTLYAVLAVVRQSFENFHFAQKTQEIVKLISNFAAAYEKFRERFADLGQRLQKASELYEDISQTSFRKLDSTILKIEKVRHGETESSGEPLSPLPIAPGTAQDPR
ncbi:MAG: DNA recombination protein RmuC [Elusimicrobia bacterium]|nr:DNA recombination protein RmuC [Elusimicrobiota bacterium]